ncbi:MAG: NAD(P)-dependent glycerol-3-phosphate dehydrogenase [Myxococcales bacterium]|nr:MAG: NAD(P)-dependent glycerol-3-phosphate dehydrogenase [Myxococcales bacterium]
MVDRGTIAVLGAGSWGTALARMLAESEKDVRLWSRRVDHALQMLTSRENATYLPGFALPDNVRVTADLEEALQSADFVVSAVPTQGLRHLITDAKAFLPSSAPIVIAPKGIENESLMVGCDAIKSMLSASMAPLICAISGPSFAKEVAQGLPTAVVVASEAEKVGLDVQARFARDWFRVYTTDDVIGVEIAGALKNVIAIAIGVADGLMLGHNTRAGMITRGLAEISRLGVKLGAHPLTFAGLAGMGDLLLTCTGDLSRNRRLGLALGQGRSLADTLHELKMVAEGFPTAKSAYELSLQQKVDMPITAEVYKTLYEAKTPSEAAATLMSRQPRPERD